MRAFARALAVSATLIVAGGLVAACSGNANIVESSPSSVTSSATSASSGSTANTLVFAPADDGYRVASAVPEPFPPSWVLEESDGSWSCVGAPSSSVVLEDRNTVDGYQMWIDPHGDQLASVYFSASTAGVAGIIVGGKEFAPIPADLQGASSATLLIQAPKGFTLYNKGVTICLS